MLPDAEEPIDIDNDARSYAVHKSVAVLLVAMWIGSWVSAWLTTNVMTLPIYMGGMLTAAAIRNVDDATGWFGLSQRTLDQIGNVSLSFFLAMALMTLELWRLAAVALPMIMILSLQVALMVAYSVWPIFSRMGRNYDAAVIVGGFPGIYDRHDRKCHGQYGLGRQALRTFARRVPGCAGRRRILHRLHQCHHHSGMSQSL